MFLRGVLEIERRVETDEHNVDLTVAQMDFDIAQFLALNRAAQIPRVFRKRPLPESGAQ